MITLYQFAPVWNIPNLSPFCCKVETYLRLAKLPYQIENALPPKAPKSKLPFIQDGDNTVADSHLIIQYLIATYGDRLDNELTAEQKAISLAMRCLLEEHLLWVGLYTRWQYTEQNWQVTKSAVFHVLPAGVRDAVALLARRGVQKQIYGQGMGRHANEEIFQFGYQDIDALSDFLADKPYFMGNKPTSLDASAFGLLVNLIDCPIESPLKEYALGKANLVAYCQKMKQEVFPELVKA